jgi:hypothetical protein
MAAPSVFLNTQRKQSPNRRKFAQSCHLVHKPQAKEFFIPLFFSLEGKWYHCVNFYPPFVVREKPISDPRSIT